VSISGKAEAGLTYNAQTHQTLLGDCATPGSPLLPQGRIRLFGAGNGGIPFYFLNRHWLSTDQTFKSCVATPKVTQLWLEWLQNSSTDVIGHEVSRRIDEGFVSARSLRGGLCFFCS
jgi:hypothetical protein